MEDGSKKIAFCLHGLASGTNFKNGGLPVTFSTEAELYRQHIFDHNDVDVFIHTWSKDSEYELENIYEPVLSIYENKPKFESMKLYDLFKNAIFKLIGIPTEIKRRDNVYSRWCSFKKSVELVKKAENKYGIKYDFIMVSRFDMSLFADIDFNLLNKNKFYTGNWFFFQDSEGEKIADESIYEAQGIKSKINKGYPFDDEGITDFWFICNSELMFEFSKIFDELESLIGNAGLSNHKIALNKLKSIGKLDSVERMLDYSTDFFLSRWLKK